MKSKTQTQEHTLSKETISKINKECPYEQGIFLQPYGISDDVAGKGFCVLTIRSITTQQEWEI